MRQQHEHNLMSEGQTYARPLRFQGVKEKKYE